MSTSVCNHFPKAIEADALKWFDECKSKSLDELAITSPIPGYRTCQVTHADRVLVEALQSRDLPQALKSKFTQFAEEQLRTKKMVFKGRQLIHMIYDWMSLNQNLVGLYSITDLQNCIWLGDDK